MFVIPNCEFRQLYSGTNKDTGRAWYRLRFEDEEGDSYQVFLPDEVAGSFLTLVRGTKIDLVCRLSFRSGNPTISIQGWQAPVSRDDLQDF